MTNKKATRKPATQVMIILARLYHGLYQTEKMFASNPKLSKILKKQKHLIQRIQVQEINSRKKLTTHPNTVLLWGAIIESAYHLGLKER